MSCYPGYIPPHTGTQVTVDASGFNGNLTTSDDTLQEIAQKVDDLVIPAAGIPESAVTNLVTDLAAKAPLASPALTGNPTAPTPAAGTNTTQVATTAFVAAGSAPKFVTASPATLTNKWLTPGVIVNGASTLALAADFAYYEPWVVLAPITIDALGISVFTGAAAGKLLRLALFNAGARWAPTGAAVVTTSTLAADVAANTRVVGTFSSVTIAPGMYVAAYISDGAPTVRTLLGEPITGTLRSNDASNQLMDYFYDGSGSRNWVSAGFPSSPTMATGTYSQVAFRFAMDCREA